MAQLSQIFPLKSKPLAVHCGTPGKLKEKYAMRVFKMKQAGAVTVVLSVLILAACHTPGGRSAGDVVDD